MRIWRTCIGIGHLRILVSVWPLWIGRCRHPTTTTEIKMKNYVTNSNIIYKFFYFLNWVLLSKSPFETWNNSKSWFFMNVQFHGILVTQEYVVKPIYLTLSMLCIGMYNKYHYKTSRFARKLLLFFCKIRNCIFLACLDIL